MTFKTNNPQVENQVLTAVNANCGQTKDGLRTEDLAQQLGMDEHETEYHLQNLAQKRQINGYMQRWYRR